MSAPSNFPVEPPSNDKGVFAWDKISGTWKIAFPLLIVAGIVLGTVVFGGMVTFQQGITISNKQGIIYNGHFYNFSNNTGTIVQQNGTFAGILKSITNGHIGTLPTGNSGTFCYTNQSGTCGSGSGYSLNVTNTSTNSSINTGGQVLIVNATGSHSTTITLPAANSINTPIFIIKINNSTNMIHVNTTGTDHFEGGIKSKTIVVQNTKISIQPSVLANGTGWYLDMGIGLQ